MNVHSSANNRQTKLNKIYIWLAVLGCFINQKYFTSILELGGKSNLAFTLSIV